MQVETIMSQPVVACGVHDSLNTAAQLMWDHDCGAILVVDDERRLVGIVTDRDICMATYTQGNPLHAISVSTAMAKEVRCCRPNDAVETVEQLMRESQVRRIPVIDDEGHPIGVVSLNDISREAARTNNRGTDREVVDTLAAICRPRPREAQSTPTTV